LKPFKINFFLSFYFQNFFFGEFSPVQKRLIKLRSSSLLKNYFLCSLSDDHHWKTQPNLALNLLCTRYKALIIFSIFHFGLLTQTKNRNLIIFTLFFFKNWCLIRLFVEIFLQLRNKRNGGWLRFGIYPKVIWRTPLDSVIQTMEACIIISPWPLTPDTSGEWRSVEETGFRNFHPS
jgi:hypothetical protein